MITTHAHPAHEACPAIEEIDGIIDNLQTRFDMAFNAASEPDPVAFATEMIPVLTDQKQLREKMVASAHILKGVMAAYAGLITRIPSATVMPAGEAFVAGAAAGTAPQAGPVYSLLLPNSTRYSARAQLTPQGTMLLFAGSIVVSSTSNKLAKFETYQEDRLRVLAGSEAFEEEGYLRLTKDVEVSSPSSAASCVFGSPRGSKFWVNGTNQRPFCFKAMDPEEGHILGEWISRTFPALRRTGNDRFAKKDFLMLVRASRKPRQHQISRNLVQFRFSSSMLRSFEKFAKGSVLFVHDRRAYSVPVSTLRQMLGNARDIQLDLISPEQPGGAPALMCKGAEILHKAHRIR